MNIGKPWEKVSMWLCCSPLYAETWLFVTGFWGTHIYETSLVLSDISDKLLDIPTYPYIYIYLSIYVYIYIYMYPLLGSYHSGYSHWYMSSMAPGCAGRPCSQLRWWPRPSTRRNSETIFISTPYVLYIYNICKLNDILNHTTLYCIKLNYTLLHYIILNYILLYYIILYYTILYYIIYYIILYIILYYILYIILY